MDGFEVLHALPRESLPAVIFLTAYEQHALRAFEVHALDYLLKPVGDERFAVAAHRARELMDVGSRAVMAERILQLLEQKSVKYVSRFAVRTGVKIEIVLAEDVEWVGAAGDYAELHTLGRSHLVRETLNALEQKLDPSHFLRIHRSRIVRLGCIRELRTVGNREYVAKLVDGSEHRSSRTYADRLESWLSSGQS
jgi:two-component system, LytTR family, response regulator